MTVFRILAFVVILLFVIPLFSRGTGGPRPWSPHTVRCRRALHHPRTGSVTAVAMPPGIRKFALKAHVTSSVGWLGAVLVVLALAILGLTSHDARTVRGAYLVMEPAAWFVLVPLAFASLLGQTLKVRFIGSNNGFIHPMHIHGGPFEVVAVDGQTLRPSVRYFADTLNVGPGQRFDLMWKARQTGKWLIHCHIGHDTTNNNVEMSGGGGLMMLIEASPG